MTRFAAAGFVVVALCALPTHGEQVASEPTVIAQNPRPYHCIELPYGECIRCAMSRGYSRAEARLYCRMRH